MYMHVIVNIYLFIKFLDIYTLFAKNSIKQLKIHCNFLLACG